MLDKISALPTQIRQLERRLKEMDASKVKPALIKEITDTINNLKSLLKEKQEKREQRKKDKESKAQEVAKESAVTTTVTTSPVAPTAPAAPTTPQTDDAPSNAPDDASPSCALCGGLTFADYAGYQNHMEYTHASDTAPTNPVQKLQPTNVTSEKEIKPTKLSIDSKVEPIRGGNGSWGLVMREADTNGDPLCYVKWMEGPLKDKHGMGGYYPNDLKLKAEEVVPNPEHPCPCWEDASAYCPKCKSNKTSDLKSNYEDMLKDLKDEHKEALDKHDHIWISKLENKIKELEAKIAEKFGSEKQSDLEFHPTIPELRKAITLLHSLDEDQLLNKPYIVSLLEIKGMPEAAELIRKMSQEELEDFIVNNLEKEAGAQNAEELTIMDHTPPRANSGPDAGGKDTHDEFQDEWAMPAGIEMESAKGVPGSLFNAQTADEVVAQLQSRLQAPFVNVYKSTLGGDKNVSILFSVSLDPKESWNNGIFENSRSAKFHLSNDGTIEQISGQSLKLRKRTVKSVDQLIDGLNSYFASANQPKAASLKKSATSITVFNKQWSATPTNKNNKLAYEITDNSGNKVLSISPINGQEMNAEHLKWAVERELTNNLKKATLVDSIATLPKGTKVYVLSQDKAQKRVKIACLEQNIRAWVPASKINIQAAEPNLKQHGSHNDAILGTSGNELLLECPANSGNMSWVNMQPPATPESLNDLESAKECEFCAGYGKARTKGGVLETCPYCKGNRTKHEKESAKECPDCHGNFVGTEGAACPTCGRFSVTALKTALPPVIPNERGYLNNPVAKQADEEEVESDEIQPDQNDIYISYDRNGKAVASSPEYGVLATRAVGSSIEPLYEDIRDWMDSNKFWPSVWSVSDHGNVHKAEDFYEWVSQNQKTSSLKIEAHIRHEDGKWVVWNHDYTKKLGTYGTKEEATKRLRQIEYFKHQGSQRPFSKKAEVLTDPYQSLTTHITDMKSRMSQVQERLQSSPLPKQAGEEDNSKMDLPELFEDLSMGIDLLETKLGGDDIEPELHKNVEDLENLLWKLEEECGITPKLSEHEKAEPEHAKIVKEVEKESSVDMTQSTSCKEGKHKECKNMICQCPHHFKKEAQAVVTDETIEEGTGPLPALPADTTPAPVIQNVQPTDQDNLEVPVVKPSSPPAPGQIWVYNPDAMAYVSMPDPAAPGKTI